MSQIPFSPLLSLPILCLAALPAQTPLKTELVAAGLSRPLDVQAPEGDRHRVFIVEQTGRIRIVKDGNLLQTPFLDIGGKISCCSERGLLGLAFHPDYRTNGYFYVNYTASSPFGSTVVERYRVSTSNPDLADPNSASLVIGPITQNYSNHNGGCLRFGPDGFLYIAMGDGGSSGDPNCFAQNGQSLLGKMLRIDVNQGSGYSIPPSNPFVGNTAFRDEIWSYGLRNPWRFCFDRANGDMYIADVGQGAREEINFQSAKSAGGENYGWKMMEGKVCYSTRNCPNGTLPCNNTQLVMPIHDYGRTTGRSITGGEVYRGCAIPDLVGTYFYADYATRRIWSFRYQNNQMSSFTERTMELSWNGSISSFGTDGCGEIYICQYGSVGSVYKIVANAPAPAVDLGFGKAGSSGLTPEFVACGLLMSGSTCRFNLYDAPSGAPTLLLVSTSSNPTTLLGGTIVPLPAQQEVYVLASTTGEVVFTAPGGGGPRSLYAQYLIADPKASFGLAMSNALRVDLQR